MRKLYVFTAVIIAVMVNSNVWAAGVTASNVICDPPGCVDAVDLASNAVETAKIADLNITEGKIATGAVTNSKLADWSVTDTKIVDYSVTDTKINSNAITTSKIADGAVTDAKITGPISASKIQKAENVIVVAKSGGDFTTITAALASLPDPNTTPVVIKVMPGIYTESIDMKSNVRLEGAGRQVTTIQGQGDYAISHFTDIDNVSISGFTVKGGYYYGIWLGVFSNIEISENTITGNGKGIHVDNPANNLVIRNNVITLNDYAGIGFTSSASGYTNITGNIIKDNGGTGIYTGYMDAIIENNVVSGNGEDGIHCSPGLSTCTIKGNAVKGSTQYGINVEGAGLIKVVDNIATNNGTKDINSNPASTNSHISFNVFDSSIGSWVGSFNVKSDGTVW